MSIQIHTMNAVIPNAQTFAETEVRVMEKRDLQVDQTEMPKIVGSKAINIVVRCEPGGVVELLVKPWHTKDA